MTISTQNATITVAGDGVNTIFGFDFEVPFQADGTTPAVVVYYTDTGGTRSLVAASDYTVSGVGNALGGTVTWAGPSGVPVASGASVTILRALEYTQAVAFPAQGFRPQSVEQAVDLLEMQLQQVELGVTGAVRGQPGEVLAPLPAAEAREGNTILFDDNGDPTLVPLAFNIGTSASTFATLTLAQAATPAPGTLFVILLGWSALGDMPPSIYKPSAGPAGPGKFQMGDASWWILTGNTQDVRNFGVKADNSTHCEAQLKNAFDFMTSLGIGGTLNTPEGTVLLASSGWVQVAVPNGLTVRGAGREGSIWKFDGSTEINNPFRASNPNDVWFEDLTIYGNNVCTQAGTAGAVEWYGTVGNAAACANYGTRRVKVANFKQDYWLYTRNDGNVPMTGQVHEDLTFATFSGNMRDPTNIGVPTFIVASRGQVVNLGGTVDGIRIINPQGDGTWVKGFAAFWGGTVNGYVDRGGLANFGIHASADKGAYTILAYHDDAGSTGAAAPTNMWFTNNKITNPFSCGIYTVDCINVHSTGNEISGQSDTSNATLPKGGIVYNQNSGSSSICDNQLDQNFCGIAEYGNGDNVTTIANNRGKSTVANAFGIFISGSSTTTDSTVHALANNQMEVTGAGSQALFIHSGTATNQCGCVDVMGGRYVGGYACIFTQDQSGALGAVAKRIWLGGGVQVAGAPSNVGISHQTIATPITFDGVEVDGSAFAVGTQSVAIGGATKVNIVDLTFRGQNAAPATQVLHCTGAIGSMPVGAVKFIGVAAAWRIGSTNFGKTIPTWASDMGTVVEDLFDPAVGKRGWLNTDGATAWSVF